jgi:hypothetical protein
MSPRLFVYLLDLLRGVGILGFVRSSAILCSAVFSGCLWGGIFMSRVLSTEQAKAAIGQVQSIINGGFTDQISALDAQGRVLSDPNVWDGPLAAQFRGSTWPETKAALDKAKEELEQLRGQLQKISQDIFSAGGGA